MRRVPSQSGHAAEYAIMFLSAWFWYYFLVGLLAGVTVGLGLWVMMHGTPGNRRR
jgi:hypothetical protein